MKRIALLASLFLLAPLATFAHEVYVLTPSEIQQGVTTPPFDGVAVAWSDLMQFAFWTFVTVLTVFIVFWVSIVRSVEMMAMPLFRMIHRYGAPIARITVGISFLAAAYYGASYGPELPLVATFGAATEAVRVILVVIGTLIITGTYARIAASVALVLFAVAVYFHGVYMLTYTNYLGEILVLLILGGHHGSQPRAAHEIARESRHALGFAHLFESLGKRFAPYSFALLRVCFGTSLLYASFYAKILHNNLALQVASLPLAGHPFGIAHYLGLEPHFLVLGAAIVEIVIALFFILGIEIRFTSLFLLCWLSLSLIYFGEVVWPHIILIGIPIAFMCWGYDRYSLEGWLFKKGAREPVL